MGDAGRALVEKAYRWQDNMRLLERLYERVVSDGRATQSA
jgi:hypothetical protein